MSETAALLDREDVWSLNSYLAVRIAEGCRTLADNLHGCPNSLVVDGDVEAGCDRWRAILLAMAEGFQAFADDAPREELTPRLDRSLDLFRQWFGDLWD